MLSQLCSLKLVYCKNILALKSSQPETFHLIELILQRQRCLLKEMKKCFLYLGVIIYSLKINIQICTWQDLTLLK
ncbi:hypothetical protein FGO68_gene3320 [Halteria grandinella]|uniref:Uncharacterized protein n=1 Tax=Halteria grandinella TaxID=5974 RepID=A0A8J8NQ04_HALGN|nr:hypothetical protein FGO68_gene3320 [Halteria grandinella]